MTYELDAAGVAIYADKEAVDATTPHGKAMLQMAAVFAELERGMIRERVVAGLERVKAEIAALPPGAERRNGKKLIGRPKVAGRTERAVQERLKAGEGILKVAKGVGVGVSTVQRIKAEMPLQPA